MYVVRVHVESHIDRILPEMILLVKTHSAPSMRLSALKVMQAAIALPYPVLHPHRNALLQAITSALDDPRRAVRLAAVSCRHTWSSS